LRRPPQSPPSPYAPLFRAEVDVPPELALEHLPEKLRPLHAADVGRGDGDIRLGEAPREMIGEHRQRAQVIDGNAIRIVERGRIVDRKSTRLNSSHVKRSYA